VSVSVIAVLLVRVDRSSVGTVPFVLDDRSNRRPPVVRILDRSGPPGDNRWVRGYGQYCPVALGAEIFAERWTPIIVRNLTVGCRRFGEILDGAPGLPRSVLSERLHHLQAQGTIRRRPPGRPTRSPPPGLSWARSA
jgi:DNA-binding HxlR family transcriptional regulator